MTLEKNKTRDLAFNFCSSIFLWFFFFLSSSGTHLCFSNVDELSSIRVFPLVSTIVVHRTGGETRRKFDESSTASNDRQLLIIVLLSRRYVKRVFPWWKLRGYKPVCANVRTRINQLIANSLNAVFKKKKTKKIQIIREFDSNRTETGF